MGGTRAVVTVRRANGDVCYINTDDMAKVYLLQIATSEGDGGLSTKTAIQVDAAIADRAEAVADELILQYNVGARFGKGCSSGLQAYRLLQKAGDASANAARSSQPLVPVKAAAVTTTQGRLTNSTSVRALMWKCRRVSNMRMRSLLVDCFLLAVLSAQLKIHQRSQSTMVVAMVAAAVVAAAVLFRDRMSKKAADEILLNVLGRNPSYPVERIPKHIKALVVVVTMAIVAEAALRGGTMSTKAVDVRMLYVLKVKRTRAARSW